MTVTEAKAELVVVCVDGHIATVYLNRPDSLNAVSTPLLAKLVEVFDRLEANRDVRCVVLKGEGRAFCVGADVKERPQMSADEVRARRVLAPRAFGAMRRFSRPVIASVHGFAIGSGLEMAMNCDIIVAADDTVMGLIEVKRASIPAGGGTQLLPRLVGLLRARELIFTGRKFTAVEAAGWGLVNYALPQDQLDQKVAEIAGEIAAAAPIGCIQSKRAIDLGYDLDFDKGVALEAALYERIITSRDRAEALQATVERRAPVFRGE